MMAIVLFKAGHVLCWNFLKQGVFTCKPFVGGGFQPDWKVLVSMGFFPKQWWKYASNHDHLEPLETVAPNDPTECTLSFFLKTN